ncbi:methyltransferase domain-containing protein [Alienimonas chondri]|uniref:Methyltransferase domain-containing protein n=1 Tax=Alienimonas chondri TaxID=2681879 RepID=A0ABX1VFS9_9PLAN|nr:methyltransferase domain-containing protein [Alienimonas chondri]NNJ26123.1 hypothetical protein [Alienimonas chondri]
MSVPSEPPAASLARRRVEPEVMDDPDLDPAAHRQALAGLKRLNAMSGTTGSLARALTPILQNVTGRTPRVLDVACGGGDGAVALAEQLSTRLRRTVEVDGCDLSPVAVGEANQLALQAGFDADFREADALAGPLPTPADPEPGGEHYDAAVSSLFLHHLQDDDAPRVLRNMAEAANAIVISDLRRTRLGLAMAHVACRALSRSPVVHYDGPQSVRAAFTVEEFVRVADAAGLKGYEIRKVWPQRFLLIWERGDG